MLWNRGAVSNPNPRPKALLFDAAGTLVHLAEPVAATYARFAAERRAVLDVPLLNAGFKASFRALGMRPPGTIPRDGDDLAWWREVVRRSVAAQPLPPDFDFEEWFLALYRHFAKPEAWVPEPGTASFLAALRDAGFRLAVLSNWDSRLRPVLNGLGLAPFFEALFISSEHGLAKPDPAFFLLALQALGVAPEEAWMVGDDEGNDLAPARALGMGAHRVHVDMSGFEGGSEAPLATLVEALTGSPEQKRG